MLIYSIILHAHTYDTVSVICSFLVMSYDSYNASASLHVQMGVVPIGQHITSRTGFTFYL